MDLMMPGPSFLLKASVVRDARQLLSRGDMRERHAEFRLCYGLARNELLRACFGDDRSSLDRCGADPRIVDVERLSLAQRHLGQEPSRFGRNEQRMSADSQQGN
jgi:hypothetical protein